MTTTDDEDPPQRMPVRWPLWIAGGILLFVAVVFVRRGFWDRTQPSRERDLAGVHLGVLADSIGMFHLDHHALPQTLDDLLQKDARSGEPYIERIPRDPWAHAYTYKILNEGRGQFEVRSGGEDGIVGTDDDLVKTTEAVPRAADRRATRDILTWSVVADLNALRDQLESAKRAHKAVVVVVWAEWNHFSKTYDALLDGDAQLKSAFGELLRLRIDVTQNSAETLLKELGVPPDQQPYMVFLSREGRLVRQLDVSGDLGERSRDELLRRVQELLRTK